MLTSHDATKRARFEGSIGCTPKGSYGNTAFEDWGSEKVLERVLAKGSQKGSEKGAFF